jgi:hypothetical protein
MTPPLSDAKIACRKNINGKIVGRFFQKFLRRDYNKSYTQSQCKKNGNSPHVTTVCLAVGCEESPKATGDDGAV